MTAAALGVALAVPALVVPVGTPAEASTSLVFPGTRCPVFPPDNFWNVRVDHLRVHPRSRQWIANMHSASRLHPDFGPSFGVQPVPYGIPITVVHGGNRVPVTFDYASESDQVAYPLSDATAIEGGPAADGDRHAIVVDADTCTLFETWNTRHSTAGWTAGSGATWSLLSNHLRPRGWTSADAAGLPILPGLLRWDEVQAGMVAHAIRFTTDLTQRAFVWPARHQAGSRTDPRFPPMGARFRLKASFPISRYSVLAQVVLTAMKRYGLVLADNGSPWYFQGDASPEWPSALVDELKTIPANQFEAVDTALLQARPNSAAVRTVR